MLDTILLIFAVAVFIGFNLPIALKFGVQKSISANIHVLQGPIQKSYYSLFILGISIPLIIVSDNELGVIAGLLLTIDFAAPSGGDKLQNFLHTFGADAGIAVGMMSLVVAFGLWYIPAIFILFSFYAVKNIRNSTYYIECVAFFGMIIGLFIK